MSVRYIRVALIIFLFLMISFPNEEDGAVDVSRRACEFPGALSLS